jgi:hypothetical protein
MSYIHEPFSEPLQPLVGAGAPEGVRQEYTWYLPAYAVGTSASKRLKISAGANPAGASLASDLLSRRLIISPP